MALSHPISLIFFCPPAVGIGLRCVLSDVLYPEIVGNDDSGETYMTGPALIESSVFTSVSVDGMVQTAMVLLLRSYKRGTLEDDPSSIFSTDTTTYIS